MTAASASSAVEPPHIAADGDEFRRAASAIFAAWNELLIVAPSAPTSAWPLVLDQVEEQLHREPVLRALAPRARAMVEANLDIRRCRCGARMAMHERSLGACASCATRCAACDRPIGPPEHPGHWCAPCGVLGAARRAAERERGRGDAPAPEATG